MREFLYLDCQTFSTADITKFSGQYYAAHESTRVLFVTYCFDFEEIQRWVPSEADEFLGTYDSFPEDVRDFLYRGAGLVFFWHPPFSTPVFQKTLGLELWPDKVRSLSGMSKGAGWPTRFIDFYHTVCKDGKNVRAYTFAPYSKQEVDISPYIDRFCVDGEYPEENQAAWHHFLDACKKRLWAQREIHRNLLTQDYLKTGQALIDTII